MKKWTRYNVCIPPFAHEDQEIIAAEKGIALFVEKPVSVTMQKAREVDAAIRKKQRGIVRGISRAIFGHYRTGKRPARRPPRWHGNGILDGRHAASALVAAQRNVGRSSR